MTCSTFVVGAEPSTKPEAAADTQHGDHMIAAYFKAETDRLRTASLAEIKTLDDWKNQRNKYRQQLF